MSALFSPLTIRGITFKNRIGVSPMCEYSAVDGLPNQWHLVHLGSRAVGGAALVFAEATAVEPKGRISPGDTGIYNEATEEAWTEIVKFLVQEGSVPGIQLAHAGRKASMNIPWKGGKHLSPSEGGWSPIFAPSAIPFDDGYGMPVALDEEGIQRVVSNFRTAAERSLAAGFQVVEIHGAHGYLIHEFLSPLSNKRTDAYGGSFENRIRLATEVADAVREVWPERLPLFLRISCSDWTEGGWTLQDSIRLAEIIKDHGVDVIDCSSGGNVPHASIPVGPGYQVPFAEEIRSQAHILTAAVGMITEARQSEEIISSGKADMVLIAREFLRDPYFPRRAAQELGATIPVPVQYARSW